MFFFLRLDRITTISPSVIPGKVDSSSVFSTEDSAE